MRKSTQEEHEDLNILKIELKVEALPWDLSSPKYSQQEKIMFDYSGQFVCPNCKHYG